jgi:hypothetical protein
MVGADREGCVMPEYRAYLIGSDDRIVERIDVDLPDDAAAIAAALRLVDGHDVELWQGTRKIAELKQEQE